MANLSPNIKIIRLNVHGLNTPVKKKKPTMRSYRTATRMSAMKNSDNSKWWHPCGEAGALDAASGDEKWYNHF